MMFRLSCISGAALAAVCAASVFATTVAAEDLTTDIGTLDQSRYCSSSGLVRCYSRSTASRASEAPTRPRKS
jgi:hypothetical protein